MRVSLSPGAVIAPNDAERPANGNRLTAGTGTSRADNRVFVVDPHGNIIWQYG